MKQYNYCPWLCMLVFIIISVHSRSYSQNKSWYSTEVIDSLISKKEFLKAEAELVKNIQTLKNKNAYSELTKRIYYVGKIALKLNDKETAIKQVNNFANSISKATDSLAVNRQKHLVLARFYAFLRDYKNASNQNKLALEVTKTMPDATGDLFGLIHHNLSIDFARQGNLKKATWHSRQSIKYYLSYPKSDKTKVLDAYNSMGGRMWDAFKIDSALYYFLKGEKIIKELEQTPMNKYYHMAKAQSNISSVYRLLGKTKASLSYNEKAIKNYNNFINSDTDAKDFFKEEARLFLYMTIENHADDYSAQGNYKKAQDLIEYVKAQKIKYFAANDTEHGITNLQLGGIYIKLKDYQRAEALFDEAIDIYNGQDQKNYLRLADAYYYKGIVRDYYKDNEKAQLYYEKSKTYFEDIYGDNYDAEYLRAMVTYSDFYSRNGFTDKAIEMSTRAYHYLIENQGIKTDLESSQLLNLANIHYQSKNYEEASKHLNNALDVLNTSTKKQLNGLSTHFKKPMALLLKSKIALKLNQSKDSVVLKGVYTDLKEAISILEKQKTIFTEDKNVSIILEDNNEVFEFSKHIALLLYDVTKNQQYLKEVLSFHESKLYNKIRQQLNIKSNFSSKDVPDSILAQEKDLKSKLNLSLNMENGLDTFFETNKAWLDFIETLKRDYPKYHALRYESISKSLDDFTTSFKDSTTVVRYVFVNEELYAFVIEKNTIKMYHLESAKLNNLRSVNHNNDAFSKPDFESNHMLYSVLWQPFEEVITNNNIVIVPDAELFNLSFETFTTKKINSFEALVKNSLLSAYSISYNYSLLLIDKKRTPKFFEKNFIAFTPEFNKQMKDDYVLAVKDSVLLDKTYMTLLPQPFAVDLANEYSKLFQGNSFVNEKALKQIFTNQAKEHKIIHIGTHAESNNISPEFSRLIFAKNLNDSDNTDDNSLYTFEIYNHDLSSNLAILTACETGKPTFQAGEGMISLAHAFNYAGSESILTSLWKIDEQSSAIIIENFYNYLKGGLTKDKALQKAKLDYLSTAKGRTMAPQYWAGLVLIGDTSPIDIETSSPFILYFIGILFLIFVVLFIKKRQTKKELF